MVPGVPVMSKLPPTVMVELSFVLPNTRLPAIVLPSSVPGPLPVKDSPVVLVPPIVIAVEVVRGAIVTVPVPAFTLPSGYQTLSAVMLTGPWVELVLIAPPLVNALAVTDTPPMEVLATVAPLAMLSSGADSVTAPAAAIDAITAVVCVPLKVAAEEKSLTVVIPVAPKVRELPDVRVTLLFETVTAPPPVPPVVVIVVPVSCIAVSAF